MVKPFEQTQGHYTPVFLPGLCKRIVNPIVKVRPAFALQPRNSESQRCHPPAPRVHDDSPTRSAAECWVEPREDLQSPGDTDLVFRPLDHDSPHLNRLFPSLNLTTSWNKHGLLFVSTN